MDQPVVLRPAQEEILRYEGGRMAVSAVPGSGKTFTLSLLAARLIGAGFVDPQQGQNVLIVTYMNSAVENFRQRIRDRLLADGTPPLGYDVRTLHSLGLEIVRFASGGDDRLRGGNDLLVLDDAQSSLFLNRAIETWRGQHPEVWRAFLPDEDLRRQNQWQTIVERTARALIRSAKNQRYRPETILDRLHPLLTAGAAAPAEPEGSNPYFLWMFAGIYDAYQRIVIRQGALDFDDLIWEAADLLQRRPDLAPALAARWPYVLEDEAQDSVPLQEVLLEALTAPSGNLVRVGDPNQAITSTFTAAHPRFFMSFLNREDVLTLPLPNSGRSAPLIFEAANALLHWVMDNHPVPEVAANTFRRQDILPTPPGDAQPNPSDARARIRIKVYRHREDEELPAVARLAARYATERPDDTLAVLVPTNELGHRISARLDELKVDHDNLLRGGSRERRIAAALHAMLNVLADPLSSRGLAGAYEALSNLDHPATAAVGQEPPDPERMQTLLRSVYQPERLLFPQFDGDLAAALPAGVAGAAELQQMERFAAFMQALFELRPLPIDDLALALGDRLFATGGGDELDLALAYQVAAILRRWRDAQPDWRLPDLVLQLADVAAGRRLLPLSSPEELGFEPQPGRITLITQHKAKGLEWDAVFLIGVDGRWLPGNLDAYFQGTYDFLGGNPEAQVISELLQLMTGAPGVYAGRSPTESANIEVISERLRLLYVAVTRARRFLHISRSRAARSYRKEFAAEPATVMAVLHHYLQERGA